MITMAADIPDEVGPDFDKRNSTFGSNSPFDGSLTPAELTAEIGRCLRAQHPVSLTEPLPDELADLIRRLQEREDGTS